LILDVAISSFTNIAADKSPTAQQEIIRNSLPLPYSAKEDIKLLDKQPKHFIHSREDKMYLFMKENWYTTMLMKKNHSLFMKVST
jgi:hypothetical protein